MQRYFPYGTSMAGPLTGLGFFGPSVNPLEHKTPISSLAVQHKVPAGDFGSRSTIRPYEVANIKATIKKPGGLPDLAALKMEQRELLQQARANARRPANLSFPYDVTAAGFSKLAEAEARIAAPTIEPVVKISKAQRDAQYLGRAGHEERATVHMVREARARQLAPDANYVEEHLRPGMKHLADAEARIGTKATEIKMTELPKTGTAELPKKNNSVRPYKGGTVTEIGGQTGPALSRELESSLNRHTTAAHDAVSLSHIQNTTESTMENVTEAGKAGKFTTKLLNVVRHTEESLAKGVAKAAEGGKTLSHTIKPGDIRWSRVAMIGLPIAGITAMFVAGTGDKGPGKHAEQEANREQTQGAMGVA